MIQAAMIFGILFTNLAMAQGPVSQPVTTCSDRMAVLRGERYGYQQVSKASYSAMSKGLVHFNGIAQTEGAIRQYVAYFNLKYGTVSGYRYIVVAKDRSTTTEITYYLDVAKKLVYAKASGDAGKAYWFCE